jgi:hypothetical protein
MIWRNLNASNSTTYNVFREPSKELAEPLGSAEPRYQFHQRFYVRIFRTNIVSAAFSSYILALAKNLYKKREQKMLMKLTEG